MKRGFTMIELVFVIVILGILAGIAIPRLMVTRDDAELVLLKNEIAAARAGIKMNRSKNMMSGNVKWLENCANDDKKCINRGGVILGAVIDGGSIEWQWDKKYPVGKYTPKKNKFNTKCKYDERNGNFSCTSDKGDL